MLISKKNEIVSIIGHSGCGKSTLLNMIAGLDSQTEGHIILNNKEITWDLDLKGQWFSKITHYFLG